MARAINMRDALKEFSKREVLPKFVSKQDTAKKERAKRRAIQRGRRDIQIGFMNERIENKKRQRNAGNRWTMNRLKKGKGLTIEQRELLIMQWVERKERENRQVGDIERILS